MHYTYKTQNTCSTLIDFDINDGVVTNLKFTGGCNGNLKAVSALVNGMSAEDIVSKLSGITCGLKNTSCGDQLSKAVLLAKECEEKEKQKG